MQTGLFGLVASVVLMLPCSALQAADSEDLSIGEMCHENRQTQSMTRWGLTCTFAEEHARNDALNFISNSMNSCKRMGGTFSYNGPQCNPCFVALNGYNATCNPTVACKVCME